MHGIAVLSKHAPQGMTCMLSFHAHFFTGPAIGTCSGLQALSDNQIPALCFGNRNISLVSAAAAPFLSSHPDSALFMAMSFLPIFILPQLQTLWMNESDKRRQGQNLPLSSGRVLPTTEN